MPTECYMVKKTRNCDPTKICVFTVYNVIFHFGQIRHYLFIKTAFDNGLHLSFNKGKNPNHDIF